eukprot:scaffold7052_cov254-Pinguiococcus_pyrenoidosus.AAC.22
MQKTNLLHHAGNPIVSTRINSRCAECISGSLKAKRELTLCLPPNRFAFVEFRSVEEATSALNLNGVPFMGTLLKIGRPSKYVGPASQAVTWQELTGERPDPQVVDPSTKLYRELFVGNTAPEVTAPLLMDFLNAALVKVGWPKLMSRCPTTWCSRSCGLLEGGPLVRAGHREREAQRKVCLH